MITLKVSFKRSHVCGLYGTRALLAVFCTTTLPCLRVANAHRPPQDLAASRDADSVFDTLFHADVVYIFQLDSSEENIATTSSTEHINL